MALGHADVGSSVFFSQPKWGNSESRDWEGEEAPEVQGTAGKGQAQPRRIRCDHVLKGKAQPCPLVRAHASM